MLQDQIKAGTDRGGMSLRALRDRLTAIIEENEARGWSERNDAAVALRVQRSGRKADRYFLVRHAAASLTTIDTVAVSTLLCREAEDELHVR